MPIQVIDSWEVSIRHCEINRFADIFGTHTEIGTNNVEFRNLMQLLTRNRYSLVDLLASSDGYYSWAKTQCAKGAKVTHVFDLLDKARKLIQSNASGSNIIRYLLHKMNNRVMKWQYYPESCDGLSGLYLKWGCKPFDTMPYATSLIKHNPRIFDLFECISSSEREHEFLARLITNNTEQKGILFTPANELERFENLEELQRRYNSKVYYKHQNRYLRVYKNHWYIEGYANDTAEIIKQLKELSDSGITGYTNFVNSWLTQNPSYRIDSLEKLDALKTVFSNSHVALIYGSAGTGKSTLINHISNLYNDRKKIYIANTHPAVDNMRRKVNAANRSFMTIKTFLSKYNNETECDILFIDECSTVSNKDMRDILDKASFKLLVLVGDVFQIESILFGNWFSIARDFVPTTSVSELTKPYRSTNERLLTIWDRVRKLDDAILEPMVKGKYTVKLDESIFEHSAEEEIILCLNYDGLYGINNINRFLQSNNPSLVVEWGINVYKVGDPILFNESDRFSPLIYNNMKGRIRNIEVEENKIWFAIELDIAITEWEAEGYDFTLVGDSDEGNSIIGFWVDAHKSTDEDDDSADTVVPFQVAYAVSIHKAQGLEYKSVKIVITNEVEELITHNIFYTAITRAKEKLKIYWSPETEKKILEGLALKNYRKDAALLASLKAL
jgi:DNA replication protein DnaC